MPELPEVEYTRRNLERWMRGRTIVGVVATDPLLVRPKSPREFVSAVTGQSIATIERRGKWLRFVLTEVPPKAGRRSDRAGRETTIYAHLGMTGWFEQAPSAEPLRFQRVGFELERRGKRTRVAYVDSRRWGRLWIAEAPVPAWTALGPDPLNDGIDVPALATKLGRRKRAIKEVLLDQGVLAGVGNIQAIEALWKAGIDPRSPADALSRADVRAIAHGLRWTIARTLADLEKPGGGLGSGPFRIYGKKGAPCPRCDRTLARIELGGRTTTFCPGCQKRRRRRRRKG
jgi:formamidopyrimidine-DNA glycosylase